MPRLVTGMLHGCPLVLAATGSGMAHVTLETQESAGPGKSDDARKLLVPGLKIAAGVGGE